MTARVLETDASAAIRQASEQLKSLRSADGEAADAMRAIRLTQFQLERHLSVLGAVT